MKSQDRATSNYQFTGGYPTPETVRKAYDDPDYCRAVRAYKFFSRRSRSKARGAATSSKARC